MTGSYAPANVDGSPNGIIASVPSPVVTFQPARFAPRLRAGYFYIEDRRYILFSEKGTGYLEDITWYDWKTVDFVIDGSERVFVRGVEVTGTGHYRFRNGHLQINGASLTHPGVLVEQINYDITFLDPIDLGGVLDPDAQVRIEYSYNQWVTSAAASSSMVDAATTIAGVLITISLKGAAGNSFTIDVNVSGGAGTTATLTEITPGDYDLDWFDSTTVQTVIDAIDGATLFDAVADGNGTPASDLFSALLSGIPLTPTETLDFTSGANGNFTINTTTEIFRLGDATPLYELPQQPSNNLPVVMTDDRMQRWDRRDLAPEFTVSEDSIINFNTPRNYVSNPDFEADLDLWLTAGSPTVETVDSAFTLQHSFSASKYIELPTDTDMIAQFMPAFDEDEQMLAVVARGAGTEILSISLEFFDINWTSLGSPSTTTKTMNGDWQTVTFTGGPAGRIRSYDFAPPDDAEYVLLTLAPVSGDVDIQIDYVFWGAAKLTPDMWHPHGRVTVEYDVSASGYYLHDTLITHDLRGETQANIIPLEVCDTHGVSVSRETGFLYAYEYDDQADFQLGLGGINAPLGAFDETLDDWPKDADVALHELLPIQGGGFYAIGTFTTIGGHTTAGVAKIKADGSVDTNFTVTSTTGTFLSGAYDAANDILYVCGSFTLINGTTRNRAAALDGTDASLLAFDPDLDATVVAIAIDPLDPNGIMIYLGGNFTDVNSGTTRNNLAVVLAADAVVQAWDPNLNGDVNSIVIDQDRNIYAGGVFTTVSGGTTRNRIARWEINTASVVLDTTWNPNAGSAVAIIHIFEDIVYLGGSFVTMSTVTRNRVAAVDKIDGSLLPWDPDANSAIEDIWRVNEHIFLAGAFTTIGGVTRNRLAMVGIDTTLSDWNPDANVQVNAVTESSGVIGTGGTFTTMGGTTATTSAFFKYFDNKPVVGRRWLPYAKTDGLGKLLHVAYLGYNAEPWVKEVTEVSSVPTATLLELLPVHGMTRGAIATTLTATTPAPPKVAGDTTITVTGSFALLQAGDFVYLKDKLDETRNAFQIKEISSTDVVTLKRPLPYDLPDGTIVYSEYRQLKALVGQQRVVRLRLTDQHGAPVGQRDLTVTNQDPDVVRVEWDLPTNQDGEAAFLLTFLKAGSAKVTFSGSSSVAMNILVADLPSASTILDDPQGVVACDAQYSSSISDWT